MRATVLRFAGVALALIAAPNVHAASDAAGEFAIKGPGDQSCARYDAVYRAQGKQADVMLGWVQGYLTAVNEHLPRTYDIVSWQSDELIATTLAAFCRANPEMTVQTAMTAMVSRLAMDRVVEKSPVVEIAVADRRREMYQATVEQMQSRLSDRGYPVAVTGEYDPATQNSIAKFQASLELEETGFPDPLTVARLFLQ